MRDKRFLLFLILQVFFLLGIVQAQAPCKPPEIVFNKNAQNIFTEEQEGYLGDVIAETLEKNFVVLQDETLNAYIQAIGDKLVKHLPPTTIKFRFFVVDTPELNAFNVSGGRIYVTRKLIAFLKSEDELAGILGHELGHGIVRHGSIDMSKAFKDVLGVDKLGDRQDVFDKFNQLIDRQRTRRSRPRAGHEGDQQLEADRIGLFAMMAAGYEPNAFATTWERLAEVNRKDLGRMGDIFGSTSPEEKRMREIVKAIGSMPAECKDHATSSSEAFSKWQSYVLSITNVKYREKTRGLMLKGVLNPALRGRIEHLQFSPDGEYILAQDGAGINILKREPFSFVFRIDVPDAKFARFSPDSKSFLFRTSGLRVEVWDIATRKPTLTREVYARDGCRQSDLSPDGKTLVCLTNRWDLDLIDVATNEKIVTKPRFYIPSIYEYLAWIVNPDASDPEQTVEMEFSPDGRYFLAGRVFRMSTGPIMAGTITYGYGPDVNREGFIAYDLVDHKELKLPGSLKNIVSSPFAFYSNDKIIGQHHDDPDKSGIFNFPGGERVEKFYLNADSYEKPHKGDYIFVRPISTHPVGAYSASKKKMFLANKTAAFDGWDDFFVSEADNGSIDLMKLTGENLQTLASVTIPTGELSRIRAVALSDDLTKLAISDTARGGVWDLPTGKMKVFIRGFRGAYVDPKGTVFADFPRSGDEVRAIGQLDAETGTAGKVDPVTGAGVRQVGKYLVSLKTGADEKSGKKKGGEGQSGDAQPTAKTQIVMEGIFSMDIRDTPVTDATIDVTDAVTRAPLWSKYFKNEAPRYLLDPQAETVTLYWRVTTTSAKEILKTKPDLATKMRAMGEKAGDYLVQVLNANTGAELGSTLIETGEGSFSIERAFTTGDWLTIVDSENRIQFFSLKTGELKSRVFGENAAISLSRSIAAVENIPGILSIIDMNTGRRIEELRFPSRVSYATFDKAGDKLFVLLANQRYYVFKSSVFGTPLPAPAAAPPRE